MFTENTNETRALEIIAQDVSFEYFEEITEQFARATMLEMLRIDQTKAERVKAAKRKAQH